jgi:hypothetical protein
LEYIHEPKTTKRHFIPPIVGALALVGEIVLLLVNPQRATWAESKPLTNIADMWTANQNANQQITTKCFMNQQLTKVARVLLCLVVLVVVQGCTTPQSSASGKSWSQIAGEEEREQEFSESPQDDWGMRP